MADKGVLVSNGVLVRRCLRRRRNGVGGFHGAYEEMGVALMVGAAA